MDLTQERGRIEQSKQRQFCGSGTAPWNGKLSGRVRRGGSVSRRLGTFWRLRVGGGGVWGRAVDTAMGLWDRHDADAATDSARASVLGGGSAEGRGCDGCAVSVRTWMRGIRRQRSNRKCAQVQGEEKKRPCTQNPNHIFVLAAWLTLRRLLRVRGRRLNFTFSSFWALVSSVKGRTYTVLPPPQKPLNPTTPHLFFIVERLPVFLSLRGGAQMKGRETMKRRIERAR